MLQINHPYDSLALLKTELDNHNIDFNNDKILIQVFTSVLDKEKIKNSLSDISSLLPNAKIIGASTDGEIINGSMVENKTILSISVFEKTNIICTYAVDDDSFKLGEKVAKKIFSHQSRCIISFVDGIKHNGDRYLNALNYKNINNIPIAGGMAADMKHFKKTFTIYGKKVFEKGAVAVSLNGEELEVFQDYNLGWRPVGPKFIITKAIGNRVYEINERPILDIYSDVLGDDVTNELPVSAIEFPLIKKDGETLIARSMIAKMEDGSILYAGNLNENEEVQFGLGSHKLVNQYTPSQCIQLHKNNIQASFIYSCSARKQFLGFSLETVFHKLNSFSPSAGFFTYGEFFNSNNESSLLNITTTAIFLNEKNTVNKNIKISDDIQSPKHVSSTEKATFHLIDYMTKEIEKREHAVSYSQKIANEYLHAIDTTLIVSKTDTKGTITFVNDKFEKISGYIGKELIGKSHNIVRHPNNSPEFFKEMWDTIKSGKIWHGTFPNIRKDGSTYFVTSSIIPIHGLNGEIVEYIGLREDISELVKARMSAENAEANQASFLANMSHEIRTPMNGILGFSELLMDTDLNETQKNYTDIINNSASTLLNIVNDILDFSKIKSQKVVFESIKMDTFREIGNVFELLNSLADKKSINYSKTFDKKMAKCIVSDPTKLKQIITNLVSNAIKFTHENGSIELKTEVLKESKKTQTIRFSVKDTGIGIPKNKQESIFSPFSQAENSTTRKFGGTGLGLSISKTYVEALGGKLKLDSEINKGSTFYFEIEFKTCHKFNDEKMKKDEKGLSKKEIIANKNLNILIAEDYDVNRAFMKLVFSKYRIKPTFAHDGEEAVQKAKENSYDIIFMDINMPKMNGMDATKIIRKTFNNVPIIALTANALSGDREKFIEAGMDDYLSKPLNQNDLQEILLNYSKNKNNSTQTLAQEAVIQEDQNNEKILDSIKENFSNFNDTIIMKLVSTFIKGTEVSLCELKKVIDSKDYQQIKNFSHKIAGASGNLRLNDMYEACKRIEKDASNELDTDYDDDYKIIKEYFERLKSEV